MNKIHYSRKSDHWATPQQLKDEFEVDYDPCPLHHDQTYPFQDGLSVKWHGNILLNPPFSSQRKWVEKAIKEIPNCKSLVLLLPARTDTRLFHELLYKKYPIEFIKGRIKFSNSKYPAPFPSMLVKLK